MRWVPVSVDVLSDQSIEYTVFWVQPGAHDSVKTVVLLETTVVEWLGSRKESGVYQAPSRGVLENAAYMGFLS